MRYLFTLITVKGVARGPRTRHRTFGYPVSGTGTVQAEAHGKVTPEVNLPQNEAGHTGQGCNYVHNAVEGVDRAQCGVPQLDPPPASPNERSSAAGRGTACHLLQQTGTARRHRRSRAPQGYTTPGTHAVPLIRSERVLVHVSVALACNRAATQWTRNR